MGKYGRTKRETEDQPDLYTCLELETTNMRQPDMEIPTIMNVAAKADRHLPNPG